MINDGDGGGGVGGGSGERSVIVVERERKGREGLALAYNTMVRRTAVIMVMANLVMVSSKVLVFSRDVGSALLNIYII